MGKLGGCELNFSSDIDLIFVFPDKGTTSGSRCIDNEDFFTRLGRLVIRLLGERTAEGSAFRVDMRLRPFGDSGPLTVSGAFLNDYLQTHGRDWERYAWVKARAITGTEAYQSIHAESVRPFVYRRYLDFGVFEALREMKALIQKEVARRDLADHVKLGPGGIREIEFIVQAFQLIRGGRTGACRHHRCSQFFRSSPAASCFPRASPRSSSPPMCSCGGWRIACRCSATTRCTPFPPTR